MCVGHIPLSLGRALGGRVGLTGASAGVAAEEVDFRVLWAGIVVVRGQGCERSTRRMFIYELDQWQLSISGQWPRPTLSPVVLGCLRQHFPKRVQRSEGFLVDRARKLEGGHQE